MGLWFLIGAMAAGGMCIAFQGPINAQLSLRTGALEAALVSFGTGTVGLTLLVLFAGKGSMHRALTAPPWQWVGGLLGMSYVTLAVVCIPRLGVTTVMAAGLVGQLATALVLDHFGVLGLPIHPIGWARVLGAALLFVSLWLIRG